jgi:uncharacterized membrane protein YgcG
MKVGDMLGSVLGARLILPVVLLLPLVYFILLYEDPDVGLLMHAMHQHETCDWKPGDPVLFNFHMESYAQGELPPDPGHWFHFAEHHFPWFWLLRENEKATNASRVFFHLDAPGKVEEMNSFTRFLAVMAVTDGSLKDAEFIHLPGESAFFTVRPQDTHWNYEDHEVRLRYKSFMLDRAMLPPSEDMLFHLHTPGITPELALRKGKHVHNDVGNIIGSLGGVKAGNMALIDTGDEDVHTEDLDRHTHRAHEGPQKECTKYMGTVGGQFPTVKRVCWLRQPGNAELFRQRFNDICPRSPAIEKELTMRPGVTRRLTVYQRDLSRTLLYLHDKGGVIDTLKKRLGKHWDIQVIIHDNRRSACEIGNRLEGTDILLSTHGFQSMIAMLLPRGSLYFEVYPYKYYKPAYAPTLINMGVATFHHMAQPTTWYHSLLLRRVSTEWCMSSKLCRTMARDTDVVLDGEAMDKLIDLVTHSEANLATNTSAAVADVKSQPTQWVAKGQRPWDLGPFDEWEIDCDGYEAITPHVTQPSVRHGRRQLSQRSQRLGHGHGDRGDDHAGDHGRLRERKDKVHHKKKASIKRKHDERKHDEGEHGDGKYGAFRNAHDRFTTRLDGIQSILGPRIAATFDAKRKKISHFLTDDESTASKPQYPVPVKSVIEAAAPPRELPANMPDRGGSRGGNRGGSRGGSRGGRGGSRGGRGGRGDRRGGYKGKRSESLD